MVMERHLFVQKHNLQNNGLNIVKTKYTTNCAKKIHEKLALYC